MRRGRYPKSNLNKYRSNYAVSLDPENDTPRIRRNKKRVVAGGDNMRIGTGPRKLKYTAKKIVKKAGKSKSGKRKNMVRPPPPTDFEKAGIPKGSLSGEKRKLGHFYTTSIQPPKNEKKRKLNPGVKMRTKEVSKKDVKVAMVEERKYCEIDGTELFSTHSRSEEDFFPHATSSMEERNIASNSFVQVAYFILRDENEEKCSKIEDLEAEIEKLRLEKEREIKQRDSIIQMNQKRHNTQLKKKNRKIEQLKVRLEVAKMSVEHIRRNFDEIKARNDREREEREQKEAEKEVNLGFLGDSKPFFDDGEKKEKDPKVKKITFASV